MTAVSFDRANKIKEFIPNSNFIYKYFYDYATFNFYVDKELVGILLWNGNWYWWSKIEISHSIAKRVNKKYIDNVIKSNELHIGFAP